MFIFSIDVAGLYKHYKVLFQQKTEKIYIADLILRVYIIEILNRNIYLPIYITIGVNTYLYTLHTYMYVFTFTKFILVCIHYKVRLFNAKWMDGINVG